jgi:hypothetical protein
MVKLQTYIVLLLLITLSACQMASGETGELPTQVQFPTATNTLTPSATFTATNTATATATATNTATFTPTLTFTPSNTPTATNTRPPSATPTVTLTYTPTVTNTPLASPTAIPTRTPETPVIEIFQASDVSVAPGEPFTLRWVAQADTLILETLQNGVVIQSQNVALIGTYSTNAPSTNGQIIYRLVASRGGLETRSTITIEVGQACSFVWFFQNPPQSAGCPLGLSTPTQLTFQQFERGFMFRVAINGQNRTCGVQVTAGVYSCFLSQAYTLTPSITPPSGKFAPAPEVAYSFYNDLATGGFWVDQIGWGLNAGATSNTNYQLGSNGRIYIQLPNGLYSFDSGLNYQGGTFERIN